jgi:hypothetical protein
MLEDLEKILLGAGVILQLVDPPEGLPLYGITRWIDGRAPLIQQTGCRKTDGYLIWTLFHEIGHVLNDGRGAVLLDFTNGTESSTDERKKPRTATPRKSSSDHPGSATSMA